MRVHSQAVSISFATLIEVCSGIGGFSLGAMAAKVETILFVDKNELACSTVEANQGRALGEDI